MFNGQSYFEVLLSLTAALITLLGSVGIFVSLIVQRRVDRLQDILEEFMDLSYHEETNLTGKMFRLIEKYQMQYLLPDHPGNLLLKYIDLTLSLVIISWAGVLIFNYQPPFTSKTLIYAIPIAIGLFAMFFYRQLLKDIVNPIDNSMLSPIIPPPTKLRNVSYLSKYVNVSVKSILKHARLRLVIRETTPGNGKVILKEEISFDNYYYFIQISDQQAPIFTGFGDVVMDFGREPVTGKPIPVARNINIPLGELYLPNVTDNVLMAILLIFSIGEKHPIQYKFHLHRHENIFQVREEPEISINYMVTYQVKNNFLHILKLDTDIPHFLKCQNFYLFNQQRYYWQLRDNNEFQINKYSEPIFID